MHNALTLETAVPPYSQKIKKFICRAYLRKSLIRSRI